MQRHIPTPFCDPLSYVIALEQISFASCLPTVVQVEGAVLAFNHANSRDIQVVVETTPFVGW